MPGYGTTRGEIDSRVGVVAIQLRDLFAQIRIVQEYLASQTNQNLIDKGYTQGDVDIIKSAYTDLDDLRKIYEGLINLPDARDFRTFTKQLTGII